MEQEIVNFEHAKALKELGFPQEDESYNEYTYIYLDNAVNFQDNHKCIKELMQIKDFYNGAFDSWDMYVAPTLELTAKWLREEKKISIEVVEYLNEDRPVDISYLVNIHFNLKDGYRHSTYIDTPLDDLIRKYSYESINWSDEQFDFYYNEMANHKYFIDYEEALSFGIDKAIKILMEE